MRVTLDIPQSEINRMAQQVRAWQVRKRAEIIALIEETADKVMESAKALAPEKSGDLKRSIRTNLSMLADELAGEVIAGGTKKVYYQSMVEHGTEKMAAKPYMLPAYEAHVQDFIKGLKRILSRA